MRRLRSFCRGLGFAAFLLGVAAAHAQATGREAAIRLEAQGQTAAAEQAWQSLLQANPKDAEALAHLGLLEARQEHYPEAIDFYRRAIALTPATDGLELNLGLAYFKSARFADALGPFTTEFRKHPDDPRLTILLGMSHYGLGDYLVAIPYLQRAAQQQPSNLPLRLALAHSCLWARQFACVQATYKEILTLNPGSAEAEMIVAEALDDSGDNDGAMQHFRAAIAANPKEPDVHFGLGYLLWSRSYFREAAEEFALEIANDPEEAQARVFLGDSYVELHRYADAAVQLETALKLDPQSELAHRDLGIVKAETGDLSAAEAQLKTAIAMDANDSAAHFRLARVLKSLGKTDESAAEFRIVSQIKQQRNDDLISTMQKSKPAAK